MNVNIDNTRQRDAEKLFFRASAEDFNKIPGGPIAYWISSAVIKAFDQAKYIGSRCDTRKGMSTGLNAEFVRVWHEVSRSRIGLGLSRSAAKKSGLKWFPYANGGPFRKWSGNYDDVVNWENDGYRLQTELHESGRVRAVNLNLEFIFREGLSWTSIGTSGFSIRKLPVGFAFSSAANALFSSDDLTTYLGLLNSKVHASLGKILNPTVNSNPGDIGKIPLPFSEIKCTELVQRLIEISDADWDSYETSWNFRAFPMLLELNESISRVDQCYQLMRKKWQQTFTEMQHIEENNNRVFIEAYGLQNELTPEVPLSEITLTCNPHYRYGGDKPEQELEDLLRADTMREFISYAVGCMFGRYSLDKPGLILANQGETLADYLRQVPEPRFTPDADNVIPLLDGDWFPDDITGRFREFLRVTFGDAHYEDNLAFIVQALNVKGKRNYGLRDYFLSEFYADHVKRYKKRPIYWLFSSPKGSFNALIYLHRYRPDTVSVVLQYLRDFRTKLVNDRDHQTQVSISTSASQGEKTKALKRIEELKKVLVELDDYERDTLYPLATHQVPLDLDDGVKVNYAKLGGALKKIPGLDAKDED